MTRTRVAPDLCEVIFEGTYFSDDTREKTIRQLRSLLSVARAADRVSKDTAGNPLAIEHLCALDRALARLAQASKERT